MGGSLEDTGMSFPTSETAVGTRYNVDSSVHKWLFNPKEVLLEIEKYLKGQEYDRKKHQWVIVRKPIGNEDFRNAVLLTLNPYASKVFSMSDFTDAVINHMAHEFETDLICLIGADYENEFELDEKFSSMVVRLLGDVVYATLRKANKGLSLGIFRDTVEKKEVVQEGGKSGFKLFGRRRGE
jgi:hypothetical protein